MNKYKINFIFNDGGRCLNEVIASVLKKELQKYMNQTFYQDDINTILKSKD